MKTLCKELSVDLTSHCINVWFKYYRKIFYLKYWNVKRYEVLLLVSY